MNFVGHIAIASALGPADPYLNLGSALPDLATIGRFRLVSPAGNADVERGVRLHHLTDDAFHQLDWFVGLNRRIRGALERRGVNRGASLACGHVGTELLLDGYLLATDPSLGGRATAALGLAASEHAGLVGTVGPDHRQRWRHHLERTANWPLPSDYDDPTAVAARLHRILASRPRLSFGREVEATVAEVLRAAQPELERSADDAMAKLRNDVTAQLAAE